MKHALLRIMALGFVVGLAAFIHVSWLSAHMHTAPYPSAVGPPPENFPAALENVSFVTDDGLTLRGWYAPGDDASTAVILLHPFRSNRASVLPRARFLSEAGYGVLLYDARAQGESEGDKISIGYHEVNDLLAAVDFLRQRGIDRIACLGVSQGAATVLLASDRLEGVRAAVSDSTYDSARTAVDRRFQRRFGLPGWLLGALYRPFTQWILGVNAREISPRDRIAHMPCPVLLIGGDRDPYIEPDELRAVYNHAPDPKELWIVTRAAHTDLYTAEPEKYRKNVLHFLRQYL